MREMIRHSEGYMPVLAEAAATAVRTRREEDFQFVLNMLEKSYITGEKFICPIAKGTFMDMMYMPDALKAAMDLMEADPSKLVHRNSFNITAMSFEPEMIFNEIKKHIPDFQMEYQYDELRQTIADSWPNQMDDHCAREEWGFKPQYDLASMTVDMIRVLKAKYQK